MLCYDAISQHIPKIQSKSASYVSPFSITIKPHQTSSLFHSQNKTILSLSLSFMAEEEFQEADVIFSDHHSQGPHDDNDNMRQRKKKKKKEVASSMPVKIPETSRLRQEDSGYEEWEDEGMVPPYVIVDRRVAGKMAFSVVSGNGRTLKGRDLSQVRNAVLRMTGFLEA